ncbi:hypothetical protein GIB67_033223 [Kingdonia uniflora]|uniref:Uncharacterized protein n=1 Tax=Kingdonia uniflora TaxID=39325 RepID=A0A7J7MPJ1_9MAGN|nr:hypothetical protein GIB67_033223 [Kingdonia uniflora]
MDMILYQAPLIGLKKFGQISLILKFLGGSNEHTYRLMFIRLHLEQRVSFLEALLS